MGSSERGGRTASRTGAAFDQQAAIEREQLVADVLRFRSMMIPATSLWFAFLVFDWLVTQQAGSGHMLEYLAIRVVCGGHAAFVLWRLYRPQLPSQRELAVLDVSLFVMVSSGLALMNLPYRGIASPYFPGILLAIIVRGTIRAQPWRQGVVFVGLPAAMYPIVVLAAAAVSPRLREQLADPSLQLVFALNTTFVMSAALLLVWFGHIVWGLRRQVFESRSIGKYRLRRRIGRGGMGEVWAAYHRGLQQEVALKFLRVDTARHPEALARFEREVQASATLSHPNTVRVFDHGVTDDGLWYYAMELLTGVNLETLVKADGPLPAERVIHFGLQAARALAEAHARDIVHRDVKPENLFVAEMGGERDFIKLLDFGIAKLEAVGDDTRLTSAGWVGGTPAFISPEVASGLDATPASDVYSLGATLYFALVGDVPLPADNPAAMMQAHIEREPERPSVRLGRAVEGELEGIIMRCLAKRPRDRFADAGALADALAACGSANRWRPQRTTAAPPLKVDGDHDSSLSDTVALSPKRVG